MYKITRPIYKEIDFLIRYNKTRLTLLDVCYRAGWLNAKEWEMFRSMAIKGDYNFKGVTCR